MNTLAYIKLNKPKGEELDHVKRNAWLFVRAEEGENQDIAIARMKLFSSVCEADGFHIIGESVFSQTHYQVIHPPYLICRLHCYDVNL